MLTKQPHPGFHRRRNTRLVIAENDRAQGLVQSATIKRLARAAAHFVLCGVPAAAPEGDGDVPLPPPTSSRQAH